MVKPNYQFEKRQRELAKKKKKEEKQKRKTSGDESTPLTPAQPVEAEKTGES